MKKILLIALLIGITFSCDDFEGWNVDEKRPSDVPASFLVTKAQRDLFLRMTDANVNYNIFKMVAQHWTATTYPEEANYDLRQRDVSGTFFLYLYRDVLNDLEGAKTIIEADEFTTATAKADQMAVIELMEVYVWHVLVDTFGDIPYSEALQGLGNLQPKYDDDATIYTDLFARLDAAIAELNGAGATFGAADLIYDGNAANWVKFGNSLKLRMAMRIADVDAATAKTKATEAINGGVFTSAADNANFPFEGAPPHANPIWSAIVESGRNDIVLANTFVDIVGPLDDPRSPVYMMDNVVPYAGGPYGAVNTYANFSHLGTIFEQPDLEGVILSYEEVEFLQAEAIARGFVTGDAEAHYNAGIEASIAYWTGSDDGVDDYIAQTAVAYDAANWKKSIGTQKWIALFGKGFEAWSSWRMLDYPNTMNKPPVSGLPIPRRFLYGNDDAQLNGDNYDAASAAMGGDALDSRIFWDVTGQGN
jgi:hypothetical protein